MRDALCYIALLTNTYDVVYRVLMQLLGLIKFKCPHTQDSPIEEFAAWALLFSQGCS